MVQWLIQMVVEIPQHSLELLLQELAGYFHRRRYTGALADGRLSPSAHLSKYMYLMWATAASGAHVSNIL